MYFNNYLLLFNGSILLNSQSGFKYSINNCMFIIFSNLDKHNLFTSFLLTFRIRHSYFPSVVMLGRMVSKQNLLIASAS